MIFGDNPQKYSEAGLIFADNPRKPDSDQIIFEGLHLYQAVIEPVAIGTAVFLLGKIGDNSENGRLIGIFPFSFSVISYLEHLSFSLI